MRIGLVLARAAACALAAAAFWAPARDACASPITVAFEGTLAEVDDPGNALGGGFAVGTPFSGTFTFDPDATSPGPLPSVFELASPGFTLAMGGFSFDLADATGATGLVAIGDDIDDGAALVDVWGLVFSTTNGQAIDYAIALLDGDATELGSSDPVAIVGLEGWEEAELRIGPGVQIAGDGVDFTVAGPIGSFGVVPEPGTAALIGLGLGALGIRARRRA